MGEGDAGGRWSKIQTSSAVVASPRDRLCNTVPTANTAVGHTGQSLEQTLSVLVTQRSFRVSGIYRGGHFTAQGNRTTSWTPETFTEMDGDYFATELQKQTNEKSTKVQRGQGMCLSTHSQEVRKPGLGLHSPCCACERKRGACEHGL